MQNFGLMGEDMVIRNVCLPQMVSGNTIRLSLKSKKNASYNGA